MGRALANELECEFADLDAVVEDRAGQSIAAIFASQGESNFRKLEFEALREVLSADSRRRVVALGGGAYIQRSNRQLIAGSSARVVFLEVSLEEATRRIERFGEQRPLATDRKLLEKLFHERRPFYEQAHYRADTTSKSVERVAKELAAWVREQER